MRPICSGSGADMELDALYEELASWAAAPSNVKSRHVAPGRAACARLIALRVPPYRACVLRHKRYEATARAGGVEDGGKAGGAGWYHESRCGG